MYTLQTLMDMNGASLFLPPRLSAAQRVRRPQTHRHPQDRRRVLGVRRAQRVREAVPRRRETSPVRPALDRAAPVEQEVPRVPGVLGDARGGGLEAVHAGTELGVQ